ncbi:MAG: hypothetical protein AAGI12_13125 [Pseudomonadota bacterium]
MPISLEQLNGKLLQRIQVVDNAFERHVASPALKYRVDKNALQAGLISFLWQSWSDFCREVILGSVQGAVTKSGQQTTSPHSARTSAEIAFVAKQLANSHPVNQVRTLSGRHVEPSWGDPAKLNLITTGIGVSNAPSLSSAFGVLSQVEDLRLCRNACAHTNRESLSQLASTRVRYGDTKLHHPSDMMFWSDPATNDFAWKAWVDEMACVAEFAIV